MGENTENNFTELVKTCYKNNSPQIIQNASMEHAKILFEYLFKSAADRVSTVKIISADLQKEFYEDLVNVAHIALEKGCKVSLIILNAATDIASNPFAKMVQDHNNGSVCKSTVTIQAPHFIVVGGTQFRLETDHTQTKAMASFNNKEAGSSLDEFFNEMLTKIKCQ